MRGRHNGSQMPVLVAEDLQKTYTSGEATVTALAGVSFAVDKGDFVGRAALLAAKEKGNARKCVGFEMVGRGIARHGYELLNEAGELVGVCTSGSPSPTTGKNIGIGYLPTELSAVGTKFLVNCRGKHIEAVVVKTPFITKKRPSSTSV